MNKKLFSQSMDQKSRKKKLTTVKNPPKQSMNTKSAVLPAKEFSSSILQYLYVKIMLNSKLNPSPPKNRNEVNTLHT